MASFIQPSRIFFVKLSDDNTVVGSYKPGPDITGRFLYLKIKVAKNVICIPIVYIRYLNLELTAIYDKQLMVYLCIVKTIPHRLKTIHLRKCVTNIPAVPTAINFIKNYFNKANSN